MMKYAVIIIFTGIGLKQAVEDKDDKRLFDWWALGLGTALLLLIAGY